MFSARVKRISNPRSIRFRMTGLFILTLAVTLISFSSILYRVFVTNQIRDFDSALYNYAVDLSGGINLSFFGQLDVDSELSSSEGKIFPFSLGTSLLQVRALDGTILARSRTLGSHEIPLSPEERAITRREGFVFGNVEGRKLIASQAASSAYRTLAYVVRRPMGQDFILQVAVSLQSMRRQEHGLWLFLLIGIPVTIFFAWFGGMKAFGRALWPITEMIHKAESIGAGNLGEKLPVPPTQDELYQLATTINSLLERLHAAFASQERFIADASHQLKTPLAIMRVELDLFKSKPQDEKSTQALVSSLSDEIQHLSRIVEDLLLIARMETGQAALILAEVRMDELVMDVISKFSNIARQKGVQFCPQILEPKDEPKEGSFAARGDADLLKSVFQNLIDNALKFSKAGDLIEVELEADEQWIWVTVSDQGPGIAEEDLPRLFQRFHRGKSGVHAGGAGLGLSIAQRIIELHQGQITAHSQLNQGTRMRVGIKKI